MAIFAELADNGLWGCSPVVRIYSRNRGHLGIRCAGVLGMIRLKGQVRGL